MTKKRGAKKFEELLGELEAVVASLEGETLDLEAAIEAFERGMEISRECHRRLDEADRRVRILREKSAGSVVEEPFETESADTGFPDDEEEGGES
jgi:exodeoxyribonuclease VII small subunit